jgi:hypothetical protein
MSNKLKTTSRENLNNWMSYDYFISDKRGTTLKKYIFKSTSVN